MVMLQLVLWHVVVFDGHSFIFIRLVLHYALETPHPAFSIACIVGTTFTHIGSWIVVYEAALCCMTYYNIVVPHNVLKYVRHVMLKPRRNAAGQVEQATVFISIVVKPNTTLSFHQVIPFICCCLGSGWAKKTM